MTKNLKPACTCERLFPQSVAPIALALLSGCAIGPEFHAPEMDLPKNWPYSEHEEPPGADLPEITQKWWDSYCDDDLKRMIARLIEVNPDLQRARARMDEAFSQRTTLAAGRLPRADFTSRQDSGFASFDGSGRFRRASPRPRSDFWQIDAGWELDLFGEVDRMVEASDAQARATVEAWRDTLVFLIGETALRYTELRVNEERARIAIDFVTLYQEVARVTNERQQEGAGSLLATDRANARLYRQEAEIPEYKRLSAQARNQLARLLACSHSELSTILSQSAPVPAPPPNLAAGVPADILRARPDIRAQEDRIAAQVANVGVATARLYPKLNISGALTYEKLFTGNSTELLRRTLGAGITGAKRLFHSGADKARIKEEEALLQQTIRTYESTVLTAINEVEDSLADIHFGRTRKRALDRAVQASKKSNERIRGGYALGLTEIGELLRVLEEDLEIRTEHLFSQNLLSRASIQLYKATGGGQLPLPPEITPENLIASDTSRGSRPLSILFSLGTDDKFTLRRRTPATGSKRTTPEEELKNAHSQRKEPISINQLPPKSL